MKVQKMTTWLIEHDGDWYHRWSKFDWEKCEDGVWKFISPEHRVEVTERELLELDRFFEDVGEVLESLSLDNSLNPGLEKRFYETRANDNIVTRKQIGRAHV